MFRASPSRGEDSPTVWREHTPAALSSEALLALCLCAVVILASMALLRRESSLSRKLAELQEDPLRARQRRTAAVAAPQRIPELVVLIVLDGLRADHLALYGHARETAPHFTALAADGVVFSTACAQASHPLVSHKALFTGKYPATLMLEETGADLLELTRVRNGGAYLVETFSGVEGTLVHGLAERGFRSAAFVDGPWLARSAGFAAGFERFDERGDGLAASGARALAWLAEESPERAFLFLRAAELTCPYEAPAPFADAFCPGPRTHAPLAQLCSADTRRPLAAADRTALADHYDACVLALDEALGAFLDGLRARDSYERALIVVTAGHGESLGERGRPGHGALELEELLVPLVVKLPASWPVRSGTVDQPAELVDLLPTLFEACRVPSSADVDGRSLLPIMQRGIRGRDTLVAQTALTEDRGAGEPARRTLIRPGRWQIVHDVAHAQASFFALGTDPHALAPLPIAPDEFTPLLELLLGRRSEVPTSRRPVTPPVFGSELAHELGALGYADVPRAGESDASDLR